MNETTETPDLTETKEKDWTIMVYMAGDNNLSDNMAAALGDISGLFTTPLPVTPNGETTDRSDVNLLTYFDGDSLTAPTQYLDYSEVSSENQKPIISGLKKFYHSNSQRPGITQTTAEAHLTEENSASAYAIMNFVHWCINDRKRKAKNYALIFSGHSFGFHGTSFLRDESAGGYITLFRFRWALKEINKILGNQKISILGFDSCVMSMLEVGYELKDVAETMVASEGSLPNSGWSYAPLLKRFLPTHKEKFQKALEVAYHSESPNSLEYFLRSKGINTQILNTFIPLAQPLEVKPENLDSKATIDRIEIAPLMDLIVSEPGFIKEAAKNFVSDLINTHNQVLIGGKSIDITAWDLSKIDPVAKGLDELACNLNNCLDLSPKINASPESTLNDQDIEVFQHLKKIILQSHFDSQTYMNEQCVDLMDFCQRLIIECKFMERGENAAVYTEFIRLAKEIIKSIKECVLRSGFSGDEYQYSNGISVFFPWSNLTFLLADNRYRYLIFCKGDDPRDVDIKKPETYLGAGKNWYLFLRNYVLRVTMRQLRRVVKTENNTTLTITPFFEDFSKSNPVWSKSSPVWSKSNPVWSRSNPDASRSNPPWSRGTSENGAGGVGQSRSNPPWSKGEIGNYLFYFSRFKNFEYQWDISGCSEDFKFESDFDEAEDNPPKE